MASLAQTGVTILDMTISKAFGTVPERILTNVNVNKPTNAVLTEIITEKATFKPFFRANFNDNLQSNSLNKFVTGKSTHEISPLHIYKTMCISKIYLQFCLEQAKEILMTNHLLKSYHSSTRKHGKDSAENLSVL